MRRAVAFGTVMLWAGAAHAAIPALASNEMNCGDVRVTQDSGLTQKQADVILKSFTPMFQRKAKEAGRTMNGGMEDYVVVFCGVTRKGRAYVVLNGIYKFMGMMLCDDSVGFGIVYDPRTSRFGDMKFGVSSCVPQKKGAP